MDQHEVAVGLLLPAVRWLVTILLCLKSHEKCNLRLQLERKEIPCTLGVGLLFPLGVYIPNMSLVCGECDEWTEHDEAQFRSFWVVMIVPPPADLGQEQPYAFGSDCHFGCKERGMIFRYCPWLVIYSNIESWDTYQPCDLAGDKVHRIFSCYYSKWN